MTTKPTSKLISLSDSEYETPKPEDVFFKVDLPGNELMIEPSTVAAILSIGKFLYDTLSNAKDKNKDNVGEWLVAIDYKLDQVLRELAGIKDNLKRLEVMIDELPFKQAETELDAYIYTYTSNVFELRTASIDLRRDLFEGNLYPNLSSRRKIIQNHSFAHLYKVVLAFIIEYEIIMVFRFSDHTKRLKLTEFRNYLHRAKDPTVAGSFGQILQVHKNTLNKLREDYQPISGQERREYVAKRKVISYGKLEPKDYIETISKIAYQYSITGNVEAGFTLEMSDAGVVEIRETVSARPSEITTDSDWTKNAIREQINSKFAAYHARYELYQEIKKNVTHIENTIADIDKYLRVIDELLLATQQGVASN